MAMAAAAVDAAAAMQLSFITHSFSRGVSGIKSAAIYFGL